MGSRWAAYWAAWWVLSIGAALCAPSAWGCAGPESTAQPLQVGDLERYAAEVQPHVVERCASGGCHGRPDRPLSLYAPGNHRADPARLHLDESLSDTELAENARRLAGFAHGADVRGSELFCKPLAQDRGGCAHGGGDIFGDWTNPACRAMARWLEGRAPLDGGTP